MRNVATSKGRNKDVLHSGVLVQMPLYLSFTLLGVWRLCGRVVDLD